MASAVHAQGTCSTSDVQVEPPHPTSVIHVGSIQPASEVHARGTHSIATKHVDISHSSFVVHAGGACLTYASHVGPSL